MARAGKDISADYICSKMGCNKYALATPLKELVCNLFQISMEDLDKFKNEHWSIDAYELLTPVYDDTDYRRLNTTFRSILQRAGDSMKEFFGTHVFMSKLHEKIKDEGMIVISDVRRITEQEWLMSHRDTVFIKIERNTEKTQDSNHPTEVEVNELSWDYKVSNNGTIEELYEQLDLILSKCFTDSITTTGVEKGNGEQLSCPTIQQEEILSSNGMELTGIRDGQPKFKTNFTETYGRKN